MAVFDSEFEMDILAAAVRSADFTKQALRLCEAHHFGSKERSWVWKTISDTFRRFGEIPTGKVFAAAARDEFKDEAKREPYIKLIGNLLRTKPTAPKSALEELDKFVKFVNAQLALEKAAEALEKGDTAGAYRAMSDVSRDIVGKRKYSLVSWIEEFEERQAARKYEREHPDDITAIQTGWPTIDGITGGCRIGELILIMGTTGRGKSIALNNVAHRAASMGNNVLIVGFEMPARQIAARQDSRWLGMDYKKLKEFDLLPSEIREIRDRYLKAKKHFGERVKIASFPVRSATIHDVRGLLDDLKADHDGWTPKVIALDSADHLRAVDNVKEAFRLQAAEVYWAAKALAEDDGFVVFSSTHASAQWASATATSEATSESYDKARIADMIISINDPNYKGKEHKSKKKAVKVEGVEADDFDGSEEFTAKTTKIKPMELFLSKYRDGEANRTIPVMCDFHKMLMNEVEKGAKVAE